MTAMETAVETNGSNISALLSKTALVASLQISSAFSTFDHRNNIQIAMTNVKNEQM